MEALLEQAKPLLQPYVQQLLHFAPFLEPLPQNRTNQVLFALLASFIGHWILFIVSPGSLFTYDDQYYAKKVQEKPQANLTIAKLRRKDALTAKSLIVSTVHAVVSVIAVVIWHSIFTVDLTDVVRTLDGGVWGTGDEYTHYFIANTLGYFIYDTTNMILYPSLAFSSSFIHHGVIGIAFGVGLYTRIGSMFHFHFLIEELSTPFLNAKTLLRPISEKLSDINAMIFALTFFIGRLVIGLYIYYCAVVAVSIFVPREIDSDNSVAVGLVLFQLSSVSISRILNFYWMYLIILKALGIETKSKKKTT